jgi:light-regulated signal transduction histidine kinase (bacteriophytochrome)
MPLDEYPVNAVLAAGRPLQHEVAGINRPATGDVAWVLVNAFADVDDEGRVTQVVVAFADMTDLKRAEAQLQDTLEELKRSNRDLEQFAYVASHDLQEPLRMVASYTQLLAERYEGQLDEKADRFIHYAVDGATRMQGLVNDLLAYSRVGTRGGPRETVQSGEVVAEVVQSLGQAIAQSGAEVVVDRLPTVTTDRTQLGQVFQNLIGNAIRFHGDAPPRVDIAARLAGDFWEFCVADNGVGIDPQFHERIFVIFQRLHEWGRYPGSGIGLAIVKRIVERQGGRVWVESTAGNGARFCFTLPADDRGRLDA